MSNRILLLLVVTVALCWQLLSLMNGIGGRIGADYGAFLPRLIDGLLFYRAQGFAVPWYTASFCGGLPFFPDVQSQFYSLPQLLTFVMDPWRATEISTVVFLLCGSVGFALFARRVCGMNRLGTALVYLSFLGNGYIQARSVAGHVSHQAFSLIPLAAYLIAEPTLGFVSSGLLAGAVFAIMVHTGFHYGLFLVAPALLFFLLFALLWGKPRNGLSATSLISRTFLAGSLALALSAGKLVAAAALYSHSGAPPDTHFLVASSFSGAVALALSELFLFGAYEPYVWPTYEADCMVNPLLVCGLLFAATSWWRQRKHASLGRTPIIPLLLGLSALGCFAIGTGLWGASHLLLLSPITSGFRLHMRLIAVLMFPVILLGARGISEMNDALMRRMLFGAAIVLSLLPGERLRRTNQQLADRTFVVEKADFESYAERARTLPLSDLTVQRIGAPYQNLSSELRGDPESPQRQHFSGTPNEQDFASRVARESNQTCYFPLMGPYPFSLRPGAIAADADGTFNVVNPACYVFPEENGCHPGDRIAAADAANLRVLLDYGTPTWRISWIAALALRVSFTTFWIVLVVAPLAVLLDVLRRLRQRTP